MHMSVYVCGEYAGSREEEEKLPCLNSKEIGAHKKPILLLEFLNCVNMSVCIYDV